VSRPKMLSAGHQLMKYRNIEYELEMIAPRIWKYRFRIGRAVKSGTARADLRPSAIHRIKKRIDRELRIAGLDT
jgi:hypothetical protein